MGKNKKSLMVWVGEALLIFLSIMLAFYFENYREKRSRETAYINHLKDFHFDLKDNQGKMDFDLREPGGTIADKFIIYDSLTSLLSTLEPTEMEQTIAMLRQAQGALAKWFFQSPHLDLLMTDYYSYVRNETLKRTMSRHKRRMQFIDIDKDDMKRLTEKLHSYYDRLDRENPDNSRNRQVLNDQQLYNLILRLDANLGQMKLQYQYTKSDDSLICLEIEKELSLWGETLR